MSIGNGIACHIHDKKSTGLSHPSQIIHRLSSTNYSMLQWPYTENSSASSFLYYCSSYLSFFGGSIICIILWCYAPAWNNLWPSFLFLYLYFHTAAQHCCHVWAGAPSCYLELLDKLQKQICRTVGSSLAASLEPLAHHWNAASLPFL